ncbi:MAG: sel1 repeat family protein [Legionellales bacterium]|nr:sel1 repeat family protein [Legionellales bacterium]
MKKVLATFSLSGLLIVCMSNSALAWSWGGDSFCDQFKDPKATLAELTDKAIKEVDENAQFTVAQMYEHGCGTKKNLPQAYAWYDMCSDTNADANKKKDVLYSSFSKDDTQYAYEDVRDLLRQIEPYSRDKESKKYLVDTHSAYASQHPAAVIQQFNQDFQKVQDE